MPGGMPIPASWQPLRRLEDHERNEESFSDVGLQPADEVWWNDRYQVVVRWAESRCPSCDSTHPDVKRPLRRPVAEQRAQAETPGVADIPPLERCEDDWHNRDEPTGPEGLVWLSIHSHDRGPMRNWRHLQQIKNEVCGDERWAVEVFPAESMLADAANEYHLFVLPEGADVPFAFHEKLVVSDEEAERYSNDPTHRGRQEPWEEGLTTGRGPSAGRSSIPDHDAGA